MSGVLFQETQSFRETRWIWLIIIPFSVILCIPFMYGLYWQLVQGEPWGDKPMSDYALILTSSLTFVLMSVVIWIILSVKLEVSIDNKGVHYRFFPVRPRWILIPANDIDSYEINSKGNFFTTGGLGYHRNFFKKKQSMTIHGGAHMVLRLKNGQRILLGTLQPSELGRTMEKILKKEEEIV